MDVNLQNLIEKLKTEGVEEAQRQSEALIDNAKAQAAEVVKAAEHQARSVLQEAEMQVSRLQKSAHQALLNAVRDTELLFKERLEALCEQLLRRQTASVLAPDFLKQLILTIVRQWHPATHVEITLAEDDRERLEGLLLAGLKEEARNTITIRTSRRVSKGFHISLQGEDAYYDFSDAAIAETLRAALSPTLRSILDRPNG